MLLRDAEIVSQIIYSAVTKQKTRCFLTYSKSKQAHAMPFSKTPLPVPSGADFAEQLLRSQTQSLTTNSRSSLSPPRSSESLLSILERITAILDEDDEDCDDISMDSMDSGHSRRHPDDSHSLVTSIPSLD
jgi:hypothetical protein